MTTTAPETTAARSFTWQGVRTVLRLELRQRVRSTRWKIALIAWFALIGFISLLLPPLMSSGGGAGNGWVFGLILLLVLGLGLVVSPTLSSTAINGDRNAGTLAILQVTMLGPAELAVGKLLAGWVAALAFLAISLPFLLWGALLAHVSVGGFLLVMLVLALLLGVVCAIGLGCSSLTKAPAGSTVLTYVAVVSLTVLSLIVFAVSMPMVTSDDRVDVLVVPSDANAECEWTETTRTVAHTERIWWLLAINPFVVLADSAPQPQLENAWDIGPLGAIQEGVRYARAGEESQRNECWSDNYPAGVSAADFRDGEISDAPIWPWGLAANLALGGLGLWVAIRRLRVPYTTLAPGTRVA
ncbi:ABC transporter permease [Pseudactinotalea sp.]|uniref:ABC transporter permease n=1 Tax=Pseudactinotalea sp. TaxID=1926260 RepID=UPI003B3B8EBB